MSINFIVFWALPIMGMGILYKNCCKPVLKPIYEWMESNKALRSFAAAYIYTKPEHADFLPMSILTLVNCAISISTVFYFQLTLGYLPWWLIALYYCSWVGIGGSIMGAAYALAHKEGHYFGLYKKWIRESIGHFFENWLGIFFGNVPYNFTTSHVYIHHRLDGGIGDTFYEWDFDRSSLSDFMLYVHRIFLHMIGYSSVKFFIAHGQHSKAEVLQRGIKIYFGVVFAILLLTRSPTFIFWIIFEPLFCMTYFLALLNIGFHGFIEFDETGKHIPVVNSTCIINGQDDIFGEDDHMTHHYNTNVYFKDLPPHQQSKMNDFKKHKASVFQKLSIVELSIFILLGLWDKLADHYVDFTGEMTRDDIKQMLRKRAQCLETTYEVYEEYLHNPTPEARKQLFEKSAAACADKSK